MVTHAETWDGNTGRAPTLVVWRAVFAGAVVGLGLFTLLSLFWFALGFGSDISFFRSTMSWWIGGSAIASFFVGAYLTGWLGGVRGWGPGLLNGITMWGLLVIASTVIGLPALLGSIRIIPSVTAGTSLWAAFWSILIALGTAALGGIAGGATPRSGALYAPEAARSPYTPGQTLPTGR
jgi:hypothetical protein